MAKGWKASVNAAAASKARAKDLFILVVVGGRAVCKQAEYSAWPAIKVEIEKIKDMHTARPLFMQLRVPKSKVA